MYGKALKVALRNVLPILGLLVLAIMVWPASSGGIFQFTIVNGKSMEPTYHSGDVIVSIRQPDYKVGDIVVYHPRDVQCDKCNVVHRIIDGDKNAGWVTQGDNNPNHDGWRPKNEEILGSSWVHFAISPIAHIVFSKWLWIIILVLGVEWLSIRFIVKELAVFKKQEKQSHENPDLEVAEKDD